MKKLTNILFFAFICFFAASLTGCITEECDREGLTVYTHGWEGKNWTSTCVAGYWIDAAVSPANGDETLVLFSKFKDCKTIGCYKNGIEDCECLDTYPVSERSKHDPGWEDEYNNFHNVL